MGKKIGIFLTFVLVLAGCARNRKAELFKPLPFPEVSVPGMMTDPMDAAEWLAGNYWSGLTDQSRDYPCDSLLVSGVSMGTVEQKFADWAAILDILPRDKADKAITKLYDGAAACERKDTSSNVFETFNMLAYKYFYSPNSPARNEDHYHAYVSRLASYEGLSPEMKGKYEFEIRMTGMNRAGTVAADFRFCDRNGRMYTLHGVKAPMTLLFFSNPGCEACMEIINVLKGEPRISGMIEAGRLAVLNIYIDEDLQAWREYMPIYPEEWYNGFDPDFVLREDTVYNIRAIPSLYLLDADKRVILKDAPEDKIFNAIIAKTNN